MKIEYQDFVGELQTLTSEPVVDPDTGELFYTRYAMTLTVSPKKDSDGHA